MASSITHAYFVMDVYDRLSIRSKELLVEHKELLKTCEVYKQIALSQLSKEELENG